MHIYVYINIHINYRQVLLVSVLLYCWGGGTTVHSDWVLWLQTALVVSFNVNSLPWTEAGCFGLSTPILWFSSRRWFLKFTNKQLATWETLDVFLCQCNSEVYLCFAGDIDLKLGVNYDQSLSEKSWVARVLDSKTMPLTWRDISACTSPEGL